MFRIRTTLFLNATEGQTKREQVRRSVNEKLQKPLV
jgi:hypothetical protein